MKEDFLQTIWQLQCYTLPAISTAGVSIQVLKPGTRNREDGPDFQQSRLMMDGLEWFGSVEVHVRSSEWWQHKHHQDPAYEGVILHVVWEEDRPVYRGDGSRIPALELKNRIPFSLLLNYRKFIGRKELLPCAGLLGQVSVTEKIWVMENALAERLSRKANEFKKLHASAGFDHVRSAAMLLARCLGTGGNEDPMEYLVRQLPGNFLRAGGKDADARLEFLLVLAGFEPEAIEPEQGLNSRQLMAALNMKSHPIIWKKSGRRPVAFPEIRVRLLSSMLGFLSEWVEDLFSEDFVAFLSRRGVNLSGEMAAHLKINFQSPVRMAGLFYGVTVGGSDCAEELTRLPAEKNRVSRQLEEAGFPMESAAHSQGAKELLENWCRRKRCMECRIGICLLNGPKSTSWG
jgi:hypothetical protein